MVSFSLSEFDTGTAPFIDGQKLCIPLLNFLKDGIRVEKLAISQLDDEITFWKHFASKKYINKKNNYKCCQAIKSSDLIYN